MSRITKAVQLARQGRRTSQNRPFFEQEQEIKYTQTQKISLDLGLLREQRIIYGMDEKPIIDSYKLLRTRVMTRMQQNDWKTLGITSTSPNEGKTLTAINLAISIAMKHNYTVMLVDADLRRPSVHDYLGLKPELGLSDYLIHGTPIQDILIHPNIERIVILPGNEGVNGSTEQSSEFLASPKMLQLVQELRTRYPSRLVLFDLPPVLIGDDVVAFSPHLDTTMLVVEDGKTQSEEFARALHLLEGVDVIGTVLNKSAELGKNYDYYYQHYY